MLPEEIFLILKIYTDWYTGMCFVKNDLVN